MNTCNQFRLLSCDTWKRIYLARRGGLKIYETTITQNLLYILYLFKSKTSSHISIDESTDEKANGNDLEIVVNTASGFVKLPTQAKIIYVNEKYSALKHKNQIHDLITYASTGKVKGIPLYLFYNYSSSHFLIPQSICGKTVNRKDYGCTICDAYTLRDNFAYSALGSDKNGYQNWIIPSFSDLHPTFCNPFWVIACCHSNVDTVDNLRRVLKVEEYDLEIKIYSKDELMEETFWQPLSLENVDIEGDSLTYADNINYSRKQSGFNPKFRIIIG